MTMQLDLLVFNAFFKSIIQEKIFYLLEDWLGLNFDKKWMSSKNVSGGVFFEI